MKIIHILNEDPQPVVRLNNLPVKTPNSKIEVPAKNLTSNLLDSLKKFISEI